jgi:hypothetical protein
MTHDELLERIRKRNGELCDTIMDADDKICRPFHAGFSALRAVVELHHEHISGSGDVYCYNCQQKYPCLTIQAIEKELI